MIETKEPHIVEIDLQIGINEEELAKVEAADFLYLEECINSNKERLKRLESDLFIVKADIIQAQVFMIILRTKKIGDLIELETKDLNLTDYEDPDLDNSKLESYRIKQREARELEESLISRRQPVHHKPRHKLVEKKDGKEEKGQEGKESNSSSATTTEEGQQEKEINYHQNLNPDFFKNIVAKRSI